MGQCWPQQDYVITSTLYIRTHQPALTAFTEAPTRNILFSSLIEWALRLGCLRRLQPFVIYRWTHVFKHNNNNNNNMVVT